MMTHIYVKMGLSVLGLIIVGQVTCTAQFNKFPPDRDLVNSSYYEGMRSHTNVSAGTFKLKSFAAHSGISNADKIFKVAWHVPKYLSHIELDFFVEDRNKSIYYMQPTQKKWEEGDHDFSWNASRLALQNSIGLDDLIGVLKSKTRKDLIPLIFYDGDQPQSVEAYEFVFVSNMSVIAKFSLLDANYKDIKIFTLENQIENTLTVAKFETENLSEGKYHLRVDYVTNSSGERTGDNAMYSFYHIK